MSEPCIELERERESESERERGNHRDRDRDRNRGTANTNGALYAAQVVVVVVVCGEGGSVTFRTKYLRLQSGFEDIILSVKCQKQNIRHIIHG